MKRVLSILVVFVMVFLCVCPVQATKVPEEDTITPRWDNIGSMSFYFGFDRSNDDLGYADGLGTKFADASLMIGTVTVYKEVNGEWVQIATWTKRSTELALSVGGTFETTKGVRYKGVFDLCAVKGSNYELETITDYATC